MTRAARRSGWLSGGDGIGITAGAIAAAASIQHTRTRRRQDRHARAAAACARAYATHAKATLGLTIAVKNRRRARTWTEIGAVAATTAATAASVAARGAAPRLVRGPPPRAATTPGVGRVRVILKAAAPDRGRGTRSCARGGVRSSVSASRRLKLFVVVVHISGVPRRPRIATRQRRHDAECCKCAGRGACLPACLPGARWKPCGRRTLSK